MKIGLRSSELVRDPLKRPALPPRIGMNYLNSYVPNDYSEIMERLDERSLRLLAKLRSRQREIRKAENELAERQKKLDRDERRQAVELAERQKKLDRDERRQAVELARRKALQKHLEKIISDRINSSMRDYLGTATTEDWMEAGIKPPPMKLVLVVTHRNIAAPAVWIPDYYQEANNFEGRIKVWKGDNKQYWPEGWYCYDVDEEMYWRCADFITHWRPMPAPPSKMPSKTQ